MGFNPNKAEQSLQGMELQKKNKKMKTILGKLIRKSPMNRHVSSMKSMSMITQRKACCGQRNPESSCAREKTVEIYILTTFGNGGRKIMQPI